MSDAVEAFPWIMGILGILTFIGAQVRLFFQVRKDAHEALQEQIVLKDAEIAAKRERITELEAENRSLQREKIELLEALWRKDSKL